MYLFFFQHGLPNLKCSEEDCLADFVLRKDTRKKYPGAYLLEFQSVMQILTKCMLRWDTKIQSSRGKGILGTVFQHRLPNLKCSEEDCLADFVLQKDTRMKYPGACLLEFQSVMQI